MCYWYSLLCAIAKYLLLSLQGCYFPRNRKLGSIGLCALRAWAASSTETCCIIIFVVESLSSNTSVSTRADVAALFTKYRFIVFRALYYIVPCDAMVNHGQWCDKWRNLRILNVDCLYFLLFMVPCFIHCTFISCLLVNLCVIMWAQLYCFACYVDSSHVFLSFTVTTVRGV